MPEAIRFCLTSPYSLNACGADTTAPCAVRRANLEPNDVSFDAAFAPAFSAAPIGIKNGRMSPAILPDLPEYVSPTSFNCCCCSLLNSGLRACINSVLVGNNAFCNSRYTPSALDIFAIPRLSSSVLNLSIWSSESSKPTCLAVSKPAAIPNIPAPSACLAGSAAALRAVIAAFLDASAGFSLNSPAVAATA